MSGEVGNCDFSFRMQMKKQLTAVNIQKFPAQEQAGRMTTDVTCKW